MPTSLHPGFITLHGNQLEQLRAAVFDWLRANPLEPLEQEVFLVQSNGVAEWLKIALAEELGVCAATQVTLPARFMWQAYRAMLGPASVARRSTYDRAPLTWRLMRLLPILAGRSDGAALRQFLGDGDPERRLQLAQRLATLFDEYQVYRADWLADWAAGIDALRTPRGEAVPLAADQRWQAHLWRAVVDSAEEGGSGQGRADIHRRFVDAVQSGIPAARTLPRRVVLFGISALPYQTLQALGALSTRMQVIIAVPNPCQFYWGDIISGHELLTAQRRRQPQCRGKDLAGTPPEDLHAHSHPLLASWGRLGRDFIRMLDEFDDTAGTAARMSGMRVDLFSEGAGVHLLGQVQAAIRDMVPLGEHGFDRPVPTDQSIEFHVAHSAQREVEALHDRLLTLLAPSGNCALRPRDIVVMVPDIDVYTPAIEAVFGQYGEHDKRMIPFEIVDVAARTQNPVLIAVDWLLRLPQQRCLQSEVRDLLDVPAIAARFGLAEEDLPRLAQWIDGAGVRWGLDHAHRRALGLAPAGEQNAWIFGIRRMLLGYANGNCGDFAGIEPYGEVGGLDAGLAGSLAGFIDRLQVWQVALQENVSPQVWSAQARALIVDFFAPQDERDRLTLGALDQSLQNWLDDCDSASFVEPVPLAVLREAWLGIVDDQTLNQRFVSGGVTFCTLMPMRAVPYRNVCLLGMNDGDFPRRTQRADFDLLALPGMARPGDRSRRDDDRYLLLEALLSARDKLYISWVGRNVRDNSEQPPSVLVGQLRDYLEAGWKLDLHHFTTHHPLQPFSRRYFEGVGLITYAREWRAAHDEPAVASPVSLPPFAYDPRSRLDGAELARFVRRPVKYFFRKRLDVVFDDGMPAARDDEPFALDHLEQYQVAAFLLADDGEPEAVGEVDTTLQARAARMVREGRFPVGLIGVETAALLVADLAPARRAWLTLCQAHAVVAERRLVSLVCDGDLFIEDWIDKLRSDSVSTVWLSQDPGHIVSVVGETVTPRADKLIGAWIRQLIAAAAGHVVTGYVVGRDTVLVLAPLNQEQSQKALDVLAACWKEGMAQPLPVACKTAFKLLAGGKAQAEYDGGYDNSPPGEVNTDPCLARLWPDFNSLRADPRWEACSRQLYEPLLEWAARHVSAVAFDQIPAMKVAP